MQLSKKSKGKSPFSQLAAKMEGQSKKSSGAAIIGAILTITFLVLISTSTLLFHFLKCDVFTVPDEDGGGTYSYLMKDYSLDCDSARYKLFLPFCYLQMLIYPLGIPLLYSVLLFKKKHMLCDSKAMDTEMARGFPQTGHLTFLIKSYKAENYFFEVLCFLKSHLFIFAGYCSYVSTKLLLTFFLIDCTQIIVFSGHRMFQKVDPWKHDWHRRREHRRFAGHGLNYLPRRDFRVCWK